MDSVSTMDGLPEGHLRDSPFRAHFENLPGPAYLWRRSDGDFQLTAYNRAAGELSVGRIDDVGERARELLLDHPTFIPDLERCAQTASVVTREMDYTYLITDLTRRLVMTFVPVSADMVVVHTEDITEQKTVEEVLRESVERYERAERGTNEGLWDWNIRTDEVYFSPRWKQIIGYQEDELDTNVDTFTALVHPEDRERVWEMARTHIGRTGPYDLEYRLRHKSGEFVWVRSRAQATWDDAGEPLRMAGSIGDITALRAAEQEVIAIGERERQRIGRDLHDGLGQELTGISLRLQSLIQELAREHSPHTQTVQHLTAMVQAAIADTKRVAQDLSPAFLSEFELSEALRGLAAEINRHAKTKCHVQASDEHDIHDRKVATHLFRIAQESINNALKHSGAQSIELRYGREGDSFFIEVLDDGTGIPPGEDRIEGVGLRSMRYRARMLNGRLTVAPRTPNGTRVRISCPLQPD